MNLTLIRFTPDEHLKKSLAIVTNLKFEERSWVGHHLTSPSIFPAILEYFNNKNAATGMLRLISLFYKKRRQGCRQMQSRFSSARGVCVPLKIVK